MPISVQRALHTVSQSVSTYAPQKKVFFGRLRGRNITPLSE